MGDVQAVRLRCPELLLPRIHEAPPSPIRASAKMGRPSFDSSGTRSERRRQARARVVMASRPCRWRRPSPRPWSDPVGAALNLSAGEHPRETHLRCCCFAKADAVFSQGLRRHCRFTARLAQPCVPAHNLATRRWPRHGRPIGNPPPLARSRCGSDNPRANDLAADFFSPVKFPGLWWRGPQLLTVSTLRRQRRC